MALIPRIERNCEMSVLANARREQGDYTGVTSPLLLGVVDLAPRANPRAPRVARGCFEMMS
jgi:hypothetical protein